MIIPPQHQPSRRAQELAEHLRRAIGDYRMRDAKVSDQDVEAALLSLRRPGGQDTRVALAIIAAILGAFLAVGMGVAVSKGGGPGGSPLAWVSIVLAVTGAVVGIFLARRSG